ncbi:hypothetical protein LG52_3888 [Geobacillus kaustophilus]|uniref:Uncharacterized protein n=1 Tax=Geobacillus kaustophilus TaxID=1462 RepID=A0A0D8C9H8_GEOKU|nr:hypothetical protein LG52_3888 [Geobacillus kaustophilus]
MIQTPDDLLLMSPLIVKDFDKALKSMEDYRKYVGKAEKVIEDLFESINDTDMQQERTSPPCGLMSFLFSYEMGRGNEQVQRN